ncbi:MAG TPA: hypothetical protein VHG51_00385 [Longimicrobiaceae bacterium]|nr:hypothetical protein [Longimicrobiaceae bacterium]
MKRFLGALWIVFGLILVRVIGLRTVIEPSAAHLPPIHHRLPEEAPVMDEDIHEDDRLDREDPHAAEAVRKINSEMLQLDNQRFLLTTTAVVFVGTAAGWTTTTLLRGGGTAGEQPPPTPGLVQFVPPAILLLIWVVLVVLFYYQLSLARTVRWLAAYQMHRGSAWEWTWHAFRLQDSEGPSGKHSAQAPFAAYRVITTVFILLSVASYFYFLLLQLATTRERDLAQWPPSPLSVLVVWGVLLAVLIALISGAVVRSRAVLGPRTAADEKQYRERWRTAAAEGLVIRRKEYPGHG